MIQMVVTPSDGKQIGGMVKNKFQGAIDGDEYSCSIRFLFLFCNVCLFLGKAIREQNGMIGYRRNMELEDVKLEDQLRG